MPYVHYRCVKCKRPRYYWQDSPEQLKNVCDECLPLVRQSIANPLPKMPFVGIGSNVMCGSDNVAVARSRTFANRIANALNRYTPNSKGE